MTNSDNNNNIMIPKKFSIDNDKNDNINKVIMWWNKDKILNKSNRGSRDWYNNPSIMSSKEF